MPYLLVLAQTQPIRSSDPMTGLGIAIITALVLIIIGVLTRVSFTHASSTATDVSSIQASTSASPSKSSARQQIAIKLSEKELILHDRSASYLDTFTKLAADSTRQVDRIYHSSRVSGARFGLCADFAYAMSLYRLELLHATRYDHQKARNELLNVSNPDFMKNTEGFFRDIHQRTADDLKVIVQTTSRNLEHILSVQAKCVSYLKSPEIDEGQLERYTSQAIEKAYDLIRSFPPVVRPLPDEKILELYGDRHQNTRSA